jgi:magnesium-transporting ATPase (P-type)
MNTIARADAEDTRAAAPISPHALGVEQVFEAYSSSEAGLSPEDAQERLSKYGRNEPPAKARPNLILRFLAHFHNVLIYVLLGAAIVTFVLGHPIDTAVILAVVIANAVIGFIQEGRAEKAMESISRMLAPHATVLRDGRRLETDSAEVVPGDVVLIEAGDKVPADLRLFQAYGLQIQEAVLTGESVPVEKATAPAPADAPLGDRLCVAFSGTLVTAGQGRGVVTATGASTEIGRISGMLSEVETLTTPLVRQMNAFAKWLTMFILIVAGLLLSFGYFVEHYDFFEMFMAVVGLSVAAIPEGLPAILTITLAVGVQAMARRNAIVRRLPAIETLGSVSVICSDKTGTLTRNEMVVTEVIAGGERLEVDGEGYRPSGAILKDGLALDGPAASLVGELALTAALCNDAELHEGEAGWAVHGDPMEGALLALAAKAGADGLAAAQAHRRISALPFDSRHRYMATLNEASDGSRGIHVKGAPERVLAMCGEQRAAGGGFAPIDEPAWMAEAENLAAQGRRVLALAARPAARDSSELTHSDIQDGLVFLGLVGIVDPPRAEAIEAVAECRRAGIRVQMITGDHAGTARAIAREIGLARTDRVLTGADIESMDDGALSHAVLETDVFARTSPEHKLRLVKALQSHGLTVAMTGDGVNDAPALKRADAGVAMGRKGSEAAKEAAEIVLADDNFASIAAAVREGRTVYDNIKKVISWTLPTNGGEAMTILVALLFGMTLPITPIQILWINLVTAVTLGIALAFEPTEENTMRRPPRPRDEPILGPTLAWQIVFVSTLFFAGVFGVFAFATDRGYDVEVARTMAMNTLVVFEIAYLFFIRNIYGASLTWKALKGTPIIWACVLSVVVAQFTITYAPPLQAIFGTAAVGLTDGMIVVGLGVVLFALLEVEKQLRLALRRKPQTTDQVGGRRP